MQPEEPAGREGLRQAGQRGCVSSGNKRRLAWEASIRAQ